MSSGGQGWWKVDSDNWSFTPKPYASVPSTRVRAMGWKLLGIANVLIVLVAIFGPGSPYGVLGMIAVAMAILATGGVFLYAYSWPAGPRFWRIFSWLFAADSVGVITFFIVRSIEVGPRHNPVTVVSLLAFIICCQYFTWLAVHRLGQGLSKPVPQNTAASGRFGHSLAEAAEKNPRQAKVAAWLLMIAIFATAPFVIWHRISEGKTFGLILPAIMGLAIGLRAYAVAKKAREER